MSPRCWRAGACLGDFFRSMAPTMKVASTPKNALWEVVVGRGMIWNIRWSDGVCGSLFSVWFG